MHTPTENETNENETNENKPVNNNRIKKIVIAVLLLGFIAFVIADSLTNQYVKQGIDIFLQWIQDNPTPGVFAFMGVYFIATGEKIQMISTAIRSFSLICHHLSLSQYYLYQDLFSP